MHEPSSGQPHRIFLGWKSPASPLVAQRILDIGLLDPEAPLYVVVPTKESSRQLKEQLAILSAGSRGQGACLSPTIIPSNQLLGLCSQEMASPLEELFCWQQCLRAHQRNGASQSQELFLHSQEWKDQSWLYQAQQLCELFDVLAREGISLKDAKLQELAKSEPRWQALLHLKDEQLNLLSSMGYSRIPDDAALPFPASARVVLACVPQLSRQLQGVLARSACEVQVWIHAPASYAKSFDHWGCPLESWLSPASARETGLSAANWQRQILLCDDSFSMAQEAVTRLGHLNAQMGGKLHGLALCNADANMESALEEALAARGVIAHRPRGRSFLSSEWQHLLTQLADFNQKLSHARVDKKDWKHFPVAGLSQLLANPLFTAFFREKEIPAYGEKSARILSMIQGRSFPTRLSGLIHELQNWSRHYPRQSDWMPAVMNLVASLEMLCGWLIKALESATSLTVCLLSLAKSQSGAQIGSSSGWKIAEELHLGFTESMISLCTPLLRLLPSHGMAGMTVESCLAMMQLSMERARFTPMRDPQASLDIMGWRDLSYSAAERLVITAFHDSVIPERWGLDAWLSPSIRKQLGLRSDTEHAAHDAYLLRSILAPRPDKVSFFLSRVDRKKDPLSPSSLLFKIAAREELPALVDYLFGEHESAPTALVAGDELAGWHYRQLSNVSHMSLERDSLAHASLADLGEENPIPADRGFSPSLLADFLACPLRFWLQRIFHLSSQEYEWDKKQLNAMDQGNIIHAAMESFIRRFPSYQNFKTAHPDFPEQAAALRDEHLPAVEKILLEELATSYDQHFKLHPLIPQRLQYDGLKKRLASYAPIQLDLWKEGWETARDEQGELLLEYKPDWVWEGFRMNVTIDRVDCREGEAGLEIRVIDYKTGGVRSCADVHLSKMREDEPSPRLISEELEEFYHVKGAKKKKLEKYRWTNLQLPIYAAWVEQHFAGARISAAYIRLSRKTEESGLLLWGKGETPAGLFDDHVTPLSEVEGEEHLPDREQQLFSHAKQWALCCMGLIREGRCLVSAEQMGWEIKYERLFSSMNLQKPLHEIFLASPSSSTPTL